VRNVPVLIVGGGPVGLALAGELGWRGVGCLLVEQTDGSIVTPKMNEVNVRTMEFCRRGASQSRCTIALFRVITRATRCSLPASRVTNWAAFRAPPLSELDLNLVAHDAIETAGGEYRLHADQRYRGKDERFLYDAS
jgi:2-polyprenyl-6-methoxyphenol hydroxylase-like FAD-dependent oxidoreductase